MSLSLLFPRMVLFSLLVPSLLSISCVCWMLAHRNPLTQTSLPPDQKMHTNTHAHAHTHTHTSMHTRTRNACACDDDGINDVGAGACAHALPAWQFAAHLT